MAMLDRDLHRTDYIALNLIVHYDLGVTAVRLDQQLCFALYDASRASASAYRTALAELNLTYPQYLVLLVLWEDGSSTVGRLGQRLQLDSGTLSPLLKRLEANGLVLRTRSATDERSVEITLTDAGQALEVRAECIPERLLAGTDLGDFDVDGLREALVRLAAALRADAQ